MRIEEMITNLSSSWLLNKFSLSASLEMYREQYGEYAFRCYGVKVYTSILIGFLTYGLLGDRCIDDITIINILLVYYLKHWNTTYSVVGVFSNRSQETSKWGRNITDAIGCTFTFGNNLVKEISQQKKLLYYCLFYYLGITICTQP